MVKSKYVVIGHYANDQLHSMELFDSLIVKQLRKEGHEVLFWKPSIIFGSIRKNAHGLGKWLGYIDKLLIFPITLRFKLTFLQKDVLIILPDHSHGIYIPLFLGLPHVIHVHDLIAIRSGLGEFPQIKLGRFGKLYQSRILKGLKRGERFICISNATETDLLRIAEGFISPEQTDVVLNELNYDYQRMTESESVERLKKILPEPATPFFLHVGNGAWYKNREGVIRIFARWKKRYPKKPENLIIVGQPPSDKILRLVDELEQKESVSFLNQISQAELEALYSRAKVFLFPSFHEGFGWPIIEALACGCPVITTDKAPMSEIAGGHAMLLSVMPKIQEIEEWLDQGANLIDESLKKAYQDKASERIEHTQKFRPNTAFPKYLKIYSNILNSAHE